MWSYTQTVFDEFWTSLVAALGRERGSYDLVRNSPTHHLNIFKDNRNSERAAIQIVVQGKPNGHCLFWEISEVPNARAGEDVRSVTTRWCLDMHTKTKEALHMASMDLQPIPGVRVPLLPDFESMVTPYPEQVGHETGPASKMPDAWASP